MAPAQDQRFRELTRDYTGVAITPLVGGTMILVCRNQAGEVAHLEAIDPAGRQMPHDELVRTLGRARQEAIGLGERLTEHLIDYLKIRQADGQENNLSAIARDTGVARQTLYNRLDG